MKTQILQDVWDHLSSFYTKEYPELCLQVDFCTFIHRQRYCLLFSLNIIISAMFFCVCPTSDNTLICSTLDWRIGSYDYLCWLWGFARNKIFRFFIKNHSVSLLFLRLTEMFLISRDKIHYKIHIFLRLYRHRLHRLGIVCTDCRLGITRRLSVRRWASISPRPDQSAPRPTSGVLGLCIN